MSYNSAEIKINYKYKELPNEPRYKKKKKKVRIKKSNHKHHYEPCLFKINNFFGEKSMGAGSYCVICGRIEDILISSKKIINPNLPVFEIESFLQKQVNFSGTSES